MNWVVVSLGSNIHKEENLPRAVGLLAQWCQVQAVSTVYETLPVALPDQPNFFNAALILQTELGPGELKREVFAKLEQTLKRVRTDDKNAPRTIDADLALFNDEVREYDGYHVPDPNILRFAYVAVPVAELVAEMLHPVTGEPLGDIARRLMIEGARQNNGEPILWPRPDIRLNLDLT